MNKKTIKRIAIVLILVTVFITINNTYFQAKSWASISVAPIAVDILITILGMLGVTCVAGSTEFEYTDFKTMVNGFLQKPGNEDLLMAKMLIDFGAINAQQAIKSTKAFIINKFIETFGNVEEGNIDINENGIVDNKIIKFVDKDKKNALIADIMKEVNRSGIIEDKEKMLEYFSANEWFNYPDSPRTSIEYPYRYIVEERIFSTPLDGMGETHWENIEEFPFDTFGNKIILKRNPEYHVLQFTYPPTLLYTFDSMMHKVYVSEEAIIDEWRYNYNTKTWTYQKKEVKGISKYVCYYHEITYPHLYNPYTIYDRYTKEPVRRADPVFVDKGMEIKVKLVCSALPLGEGENNGVVVKEYNLKDGIWQDEKTYEDYYVSGDIKESNYDIKTKMDEMYFKRTSIRKESDLNDINLPANNPFTAEAEEQIEIWSNESESISVVTSDIVEDFISGEMDQQTVNDVISNNGEIEVDTTIGETIVYNPPYDDTQVRQELKGIAGWLNMIWTSIQQGVGSIVEAITAKPSNGGSEEDITEDIKEYKIHDIFLCIWDVLTACIRLIIRAGVYLTTLFDVEADDSYLNENIVLGINKIKNIELPEPFDISFWNVVSGFISILFSLSIVRRARQFI